MTEDKPRIKRSRRKWMLVLSSVLGGCSTASDGSTSPRTTNDGESTPTVTSATSTTETPTGTPHPPDGPAEPAGNVVATKRDRDQIRVRTSDWSKSSYAEVLVAKAPQTNVEPVEVEASRINELDALRNGLSYFGYDVTSVVVETGKSQGDETVNALHELWGSKRESDPEQEEYFSYSGYVFDVDAGFVG